jgi:acyl-CoA synthetase (AMP-forming)/AMP-acid ligase II
MNILSNKVSLFYPQGTIIEENGQLHQVQQVLTDGNVLFSDISSGSLVLLLCQNKYESLFFYINAIERGVVPILIDAESDDSLVNALILEYHPDYIFTPLTKEAQFENYLVGHHLRNYTLLKSERQSSVALNPELALLLSTSGTTGSPKLVRLSYNNLLSNASSISEYLGLDSSETAISSLPMNYSFGLSIINSHLFVGGSVVMTTESITQRGFWDLFKNFKVTSLSGVPYTFEILKKFKLLNAELPSLKKITQAGGKLSDDLLDHFAQFSIKKSIHFFVMYGQTEGTARLGYLDPKFVIDKLGSIGKPIPNGKFEIIDERGIIITESGKAGELIYIGPNVMLGYANCKLDLAKGDENCGKLKTGDIALFDEDGFYYIVGRIKRFIKIFGNRVNLDELEMLLFSNGVESACIGNDNSLNICITNSNLKDFTKDFLFKKLGIHISAFEIKIINAIPRSNSGKILYSKLIELL